MKNETRPDWVHVRHRYEETQDTVGDICRDAGITEREFANFRKKLKWRRKHPLPFPPVRKMPASEVAMHPVVSSRGEASETSGESLHGRWPDSGRSAGAAVVASPVANAEFAKHRLATPAARRRLLDRLVAAISMKLEQLERRMSIDLANGEDASATDHERETRAIGALIDNLDKLRELESGLADKAGKSGPAIANLADEAERCRRELADRLSRLVEAAGRDA